jgi:glycosyltransferase involved in cell wall biosynthesis
MKILFICNEYPPGKSGGIGSITRSLARTLVKQGHNIYVAGLYIPGYGQPDYEEDEGVKIWRFRFFNDYNLIKNDYSFRDTAILTLLKKTGLYSLATNKALSRFNNFIISLISRYNLDIVEWPDFNEYFSFLAKSFHWPALPVPLVVKFHGTNSYIQNQMHENVNAHIFRQEKEHMDRADALCSVSKNTAADYQSLYGIHRNIKILYNSIDIPPMRYMKNNSKTIIYTGTLTKLKGIQSLLKAWNLVNETCPDAVLSIYGKGSFQNISSLLNPKSFKTVRFEGFVSREQLYTAFSNASGAIFPSYTECFAIAPLEAMAVGCPVIYTERVSGPELITNGINGILIDPDNLKQMAVAMISLINDSSLRNTYSRYGRQTILDKFNINDSASDHIAFYKEVINNFKSDRHV